MEKLLNELKEKIKNSKYKDKLSENNFEKIENIYPFNKFEYVIAHLLSEGILDIETYYNIRAEYIKRNKNIHMFEMTAPRTFGETWAQGYLNSLVPELKKPSKKLDPTYNGEYDFWYEGIKIELKTSRAVKKETGKTLLQKALSSDSEYKFEMNFQQIKTNCCDVFICIGIWKDITRYWVLSSEEVRTNKYYSNGQHRGNIGEGQLWIKHSNIKEFDRYLVEPDKILEKILEKANKKYSK